MSEWLDRSLIAVAGLTLAFTSGCTFITSCPTGTGSTSTGGSGNNGGGGSGNSSSGGGPAVVTGDPLPGDWVNVTPDFTGIKLTCGPMTYLTSKPDEDMIMAGVSTIGLWATTDGGKTWPPLDTGKGADALAHGPGGIAYDPTTPTTFWESGNYGPGVFVTKDDGVTFKHLGDTFHSDAVMVDFSDPDRKTLLTTEHEMQVVTKSTDGGATWNDISAGIPSNAKWCSHGLILDTQTYLLGCGGSFSSGDPMIIRSTDGGMTWTKVFDNAGAFEPLVASDGSIYWAEEFSGGLARSTDQGQTWTQVTAQTVLTETPSELPDGRIAAATMDGIILSSDQGASWKRASPVTPYIPSGFVYSKYQKAFFIYYTACNAVPTDAPDNAIMRFDFDYETQ